MLGDPAVVSVLAVFHVLAAIGWLGGALFAASSIIPGLRTLSPGASLEFAVKIGPRLTRFYGVTGTLTLVFGLALLLEAYGSDYSAWPATLEVGFSLGLLAYLFALAVTVPASRRSERLARQLMASPTPGMPSAELLQNLRRLGMGGNVMALVLTLATVFMVATGFPF